MITKIDIKKFGLFSDYRWSQNIGNDSESVFKRVNIMYGPNYSGKTTLSRVIKCVADGELHEKYTDGEFTVTNADASISSDRDLVSPYNIRVYNTDFVRENLKFLYDENSDIEPFTLLGSENQEIQERTNEIIAILGSIEARRGLLFEQDENNKLLETAKKEFNGVIKRHNSKTAQSETDKDESREKLRLSEIIAFLDDIDYKTKKKEIEESAVKIAEDKKLLKMRANSINTLEAEKKEKEDAQKDEGIAALKVNELLSRFFGHDGLKLDPETVNEEGTPKTKFIIKRGTEKAHNLSEGERSLIAFCYFIAKMDDELKGADSEKLVIYIDDPISSLDNNHIFFMFTLIENVICKEKKYGQLFISTHNLEFLKLSTKLTCPKNQINHFIIQREQNCFEARSVIKKMPSYLKDNISEYSFLFKELYDFISPLSQAEDNYTRFYNLANNMRKFLECYISYRLPNNKEQLKSLDVLWGNNIPVLVNRVINEGLHLTWGDSGTLPQDVVEAKAVAKEILKAIKNSDQSHFDSLCQSVGVDKDIVL